MWILCYWYWYMWIDNWNDLFSLIIGKRGYAFRIHQRAVFSYMLYIIIYCVCLGENNMDRIIYAEYDIFLWALIPRSMESHLRNTSSVIKFLSIRQRDFCVKEILTNQTSCQSQRRYGFRRKSGRIILVCQWFLRRNPLLGFVSLVNLINTIVN